MFILRIAHFVRWEDIALLKRIFGVVRSAVSVRTIPLYSILSPPTVNLIQFGSLFVGRKSTTIHPYVTFLFIGTLLRGTNHIVLVPFMQSPTPSTSLPNLFAKLVFQIILVFLFFIRSQYSNCLPVSGSIIAFTSNIGDHSSS